MLGQSRPDVALDCGAFQDRPKWGITRRDEKLGFVPEHPDCYAALGGTGGCRSSLSPPGQQINARGWKGSVKVHAVDSRQLVQMHMHRAGHLLLLLDRL